MPKTGTEKFKKAGFDQEEGGVTISAEQAYDLIGKVLSGMPDDQRAQLIPALQQMLAANGVDPDDDRGGPDDEYSNGEQHEAEEDLTDVDLMPPRGKQVSFAQDAKGFNKRWGNSTRHIRVTDRNFSHKLAHDSKPTNGKGFAQRWGDTMSHVRLSSSGRY